MGKIFFKHGAQRGQNVHYSGKNFKLFHQQGGYLNMNKDLKKKNKN